METKKKRVIGIAVLVLLGALIIYWVFSGESIPPGATEPEKSLEESPVSTVRTTRETVTEWTNAVGTVESRLKARIEARIPSQISEIMVNSGDRVTQGQLLIALDDRQMQARLSQADQALESATARKKQAGQQINAAKAALDEASSAYQRIKNFYQAKAATEQNLEQVRSQYLQAKAALQRSENAFSEASSGVQMAKERVREADISLGYTRIVAPADGKVLKRLADPGDLAMPGRALLLLRTDPGLRLEAHVRESLVHKLRVGQTLPVKLQIIDKNVDALIEEIVPYADPRTRSFLVRAGLPELPDLYSGMYGKLLIPYRQVDIILAPKSAIQNMGQLEFVTVKTNGKWQQRYIKTGNTHGDKVEILSGLSADEILQVKDPVNDG